MVVFVEEICDFKREEGPMVPLMAKHCPKQSASILLQTDQSLSVTFVGGFHGVVLKGNQSSEVRRNFVAFHPTCSHLNLNLGVSPTTYLRSLNYSAKMLDWNDPSKLDDNRSLIIRILREVVKSVVVEFRLLSSPLNPCGRANRDGVVEAVPVSFRPPSTSLKMVSPQRKRVTTLLIGETLISFELPYNCPFHPDDVDELGEAEKNHGKNKNGKEIIYNIPRYSFLQRLRGWRMERRQRINGRFDMYYHHLRSRRVFRSVAEVVNFFMYEVYPDKPGTKSYLGPLHFSGFKKERKRKGVTSLKKKIAGYESKNKAREKWAPMFFDMNNNNNNGDNKREENHHRHIPMFDLNDDHQKEEEEEVQQKQQVEDYYNYGDDQNLMYDVVGDNYNQENEAYNQKEIVEKFLADSYNNLMNLPNTNKNDEGDAKKSKSFSFDINEKICEEEEEEDANKRAVEQFLAEAYDNLMNLHNNNAQPTSRKGKEKMASSSIEKPRRKKGKSFPPTSSPFPNTPININSIPLESITNPMESMEVQQTTSIPNMKLNHFNFLEENRANNFMFTDICESSTAPATRVLSEGEGSGSSSASFHVDECDLINHIPESSDMFDLAMFLAKNRGGYNGGF